MCFTISHLQKYTGKEREGRQEERERECFISYGVGIVWVFLTVSITSNGERRCWGCVRSQRRREERKEKGSREGNRRGKRTKKTKRTKKPRTGNISDNMSNPEWNQAVGNKNYRKTNTIWSRCHVESEELELPQTESRTVGVKGQGRRHGGRNTNCGVRSQRGHIKSGILVHTMTTLVRPHFRFSIIPG